MYPLVVLTPVRLHAILRRLCFRAPAPKPPAPLPTDICEAGTFCNIACAEKYANFDAAKGCANAAKGYCCEDTKPADYPFTPAA